VTVESGTLTGQRTDLTYRGRLTLAPHLGADLGVSGEVDLAILDRHVVVSDLGLEGHGQFRGTVRLDQGKLRVAGRLEGGGGSINGVAVPRYAGDVRWDEKGLRVQGLEAALLGGSGKFEIEVPRSPGLARVDAQVEGIDAEEAARHIFDVGAAGLGAAATGEVSVRWPRGQRRRISGRAALDLAPRADGRMPLGGRIVWRAQEGAQVVEDGRSTGRVTSARVSERLGTVIGLAWVLPDKAADGAQISIRVDGRPHDATVTLSPFYDPEGALLRS